MPKVIFNEKEGEGKVKSDFEDKGGKEVCRKVIFKLTPLDQKLWQFKVVVFCEGTELSLGGSGITCLVVSQLCSVKKLV